MAWEISHAPEAWDNVRTQLETWTAEKLINALVDDSYQVSTLQHISFDTLVDLVIANIRKHNTCDNGGHYFWIDQKGYHKVSCAPVNETNS